MKAIFDRIFLLLGGVALFLDGLALLDFLLHPLAGDFTFHSTIYRAVVILLLTPLTLLVGFLIIRRVPGNIVGPLLIVWSGSVAYGSIRAEIGLVLFALFFAFNQIFAWLALFLMFLHFPDGKIYPPGAAPWIYRLLGILMPLASLIFLSTASFSDSNRSVNPFFLPALGKPAQLILLFGLLTLFPILVLDLVSPVLRYRKGSSLERQQIKWLAVFGGSLAIYTLLGLIAYPLATGGQVMNIGNGYFAMCFYLIVGLFPPITIGVAVLRYRLYDIDIIIRRTLVYGALTATLVLVYFGCILLLQEFFQALTGQSQSQVVTVISTLVIAALFTPLRRRIQNDIDRRFYRKKYDAEQALEAFARTVRQQVDLDEISASLLAVVQETLQPERASLWLNKQSSKRFKGN
jgi:hypothetical protein